MTPDQINALSDDDANELFSRLVRERFGSKVQFARYLGMPRVQTLYDWPRPPLWALCWLTEWKDGEEDRETLRRLFLAFKRANIGRPLETTGQDILSDTT